MPRTTPAIINKARKLKAGMWCGLAQSHLRRETGGVRDKEEFGNQLPSLKKRAIRATVNENPLPLLFVVIVLPYVNTCR